MNVAFLRALVALVPISICCVWSVVVFLRAGAVGTFLQLLGAGRLLVVVLMHVAEALYLFPVMQWGAPHSVGHELDFFSALLGLTLVPIGSVV
ncbi:MAG: hypothetical protein H0X37_20965 [Herpetosiphonaceae bacterium]|nr:hypothetical protein [Herpetosiphonaceae bacterium]